MATELRTVARSGSDMQTLTVKLGSGAECGPWAVFLSPDDPDRPRPSCCANLAHACVEVCIRLGLCGTTEPPCAPGLDPPASR
jgi:hypothetical protein